MVLARGRKPDSGTDGFPDYNKLEMHAKPKTPLQTPPAVSTHSAVSAPPAPAFPPALNTPLNPLSDEDLPKPPPKAVPLPESASEPPMPDELRDTLVPSTTGTLVPSTTGTLIPFATGQK